MACGPLCAFAPRDERRSGSTGEVRRRLPDRLIPAEVTGAGAPATSCETPSAVETSSGWRRSVWRVAPSGRVSANTAPGSVGAELSAEFLGSPSGALPAHCLEAVLVLAWVPGQLAQHRTQARVGL